MIDFDDVRIKVTTPAGELFNVTLTDMYNIAKLTGIKVNSLQFNDIVINVDFTQALEKDAKEWKTGQTWIGRHWLQLLRFLREWL